MENKKETSNITVGYYHTLEDKEITISLEEYKELLIIKGKYEELKNKCWQCYPRGNTITYRYSDGKLKDPYTVTCGNTASYSSSPTRSKKGE